MQGFIRSKSAAWVLAIALVACGDDEPTDPGIVDDDGTVVGTVTQEGGTVTSGDVALIVPAGAVDGSTEITVDPATNVPSTPLLVAGTAYDLGPDGLDFDEPVTLSLAYDPADLPAGETESSLGLYKAVGSGWQEIAWVDVDTADNVVRAQISSFSVYAVLAGRIEDVEGSWTVVSVDGPNTCGDPQVTETLSIDIEQTGADIVVFVGGAEFEGTVDGSEVDWSGSYPEDGGTTTNDIHVTIEPGGDAFSGESDWSWTDGETTCTGGSTFEGTRD